MTQSFLSADSSKKVIIVAYQSSCEFCRDQLPLLKTVQTSYPHMSLIVVTNEDENILAKHLWNQLGIPINVQRVNFADLGIRTTPTIAVVAGRRIERLWVGKLSSSDEQEIHRFIVGSQQILEKKNEPH